MDPNVPVPFSVSRSARRRSQKARDVALAEFAAGQWGVVSRDQLYDLGYSEPQVDGRVGRTLWSINPDAFAVGHPGISRLARGKATLLYTGERSGLSHMSAARVWEMVGRATDGPIHVSLLDRISLTDPPGVNLHRPRSLRLEDLVDHRGLRLTTPERTLADLLAESTVAEITRMLEQMVTHLGRSPDDLHQWGHALKHVTGKWKLVRSLDHVAGPAVIRSEFESLFRSVCQEGGLPVANTNVKIGAWEVDAVFPNERVAIELDSYRWHGGRWQFHRDRRKGLAISRAGYELLRISWPQLKYDRRDVIEAVKYALARGDARRANSVPAA